MSATKDSLASQGSQALQGAGVVIPLRDTFARGDVAYGVWNTLPGAPAVRCVAETVGICVCVFLFFFSSFLKKKFGDGDGDVLF